MSETINTVKGTAGNSRSRQWDRNPTSAEIMVNSIQSASDFLVRDFGVMLVFKVLLFKDSSTEVSNGMCREVTVLFWASPCFWNGCWIDAQFSLVQGLPHLANANGKGAL